MVTTARNTPTQRCKRRARRHARRNGRRYGHFGSPVAAFYDPGRHLAA